MTQKFAYNIKDKIIELTPVNNDELGYEIIFKASNESTENKPDILEVKENEYVAFRPKQWSALLDNMITQLPIMQCATTTYEGIIEHQGDTVHIENGERPVVAEYKKFYAFKVNDMTKAQEELDNTKAHLQNSLKAIDNYIMQQLMEKITQLSNKDLLQIHNNKVLKSVLHTMSVSYAEQSQRPWLWVSDRMMQKIVRYCAQPMMTSRIGTVATYGSMDIMVLSEEASTVFSDDVVLHGIDKGLCIPGIVNKMESLRDKDSFLDLVRGLYLFGIDIDAQYLHMYKLNGAFDN